MRCLRLFFLSLLLLPALSFAQTTAPKFINLQAVLVDDGGNVLYDRQEADIVFSIVDGAGNAHYEETQHVYLVHGAISVLVGQGNGVDGKATGGIPAEALDPNTGSKLLRIKLADQSIPQEDVELVSVPYSYYAQYALDFKGEIDSAKILNASIQKEDLAEELLEYLSNSITGLSKQDLIDHQTSQGAHLAKAITIEGTLTYAGGSSVEDVLRGFDATMGIQVKRIEGVESSLKKFSNDLQTQITNVDARVNNHDVRITNIENGGLDERYVNVAGGYNDGAINDSEWGC